MHKYALLVAKGVSGVFQFLCPDYVNLAYIVQVCQGGEDFGYIVCNAVVFFEESKSV